MVLRYRDFCLVLLSTLWPKLFPNYNSWPELTGLKEVWLQSQLILVGNTREGDGVCIYNSIKEKCPLFPISTGLSICPTQNIRSGAEESTRKQSSYLPILHALNLHLSLELASKILAAPKKGTWMAGTKLNSYFSVTPGSIPVVQVSSSPDELQFPSEQT